MREFWRGKRVFLTGHTGFKGGWLALWLQELGASVLGFSLKPPSKPSLFETARVSENMQEIIGDIRDLSRVTAAFVEFAPEIVFHLAAQSLVRVSYDDPVGTFSSNVLGTVNVLEAVRQTKVARSVVVVTSDKCYENREWLWGYREGDSLGGHDPYSSSKACAELAVDSYRRAFFCEKDTAGIATARAGNVIGGGDWARDRLIPDLVRSAVSGEILVLRSPKAMRPWQHVLDPLRGYLMLAENLWDNRIRYGGPWNFGPLHSDDRTVEDIVAIAARVWGGGLNWTVHAEGQPRESSMLRLDSSKAASAGWRPRLSLERSIEWTMEWYRGWIQHQDLKTLSMEQIRRYGRLAAGEPGA